MKVVCRRVAIGAGSVALTFGLSAAPSSAQETGPTPAASSFVEQVLEVSVPPPPGKHIPPRVGTGDADFAGHGPDITADVHLVFAQGDRRHLFVRLCLDALETKQDRTHVHGCSADYEIFDAGQGTCIDSILGTTNETLSYRDTDHSDDVFGRQTANGFVKEWTVTGDTRGNEAGTKTGFKIRTGAFFVNLVAC